MTEAAMRRTLKGINPDEVLKWRKVDTSMEQFKALIEDPPLHSLVIHIEPAVAAEILKISNHGNRRLVDRHALRLAKVIKAEDYEITGDTIKVSVEGRLLDGQHRLMACVRQGSAIISHFVFGLPEEVFDVIDQGKKRTAADVLGLIGVKDPKLVAGSIRFVMWYRHKIGKAANADTDDSGNSRRIREAAEGWGKGLSEWVDISLKIAKNYKRFRHPPSVLMGILFLIGKQNKALAMDFAEQWLHGNRGGRNKGFDNLHDRIAKLYNEGGGLSGEMRAANIIQLFNNWNANITASPRALTWRKEWKFPAIEFDPAAFKAAREREPDDTSLPAQKYRALKVIHRYADGHGNAQVSYPMLAERAGLHVRHAGPVITALCKGRLLHMVQKPGPNNPATYKITDGGFKYMTEYAEAN
jgi:hypothetical protein